VATETAPVDTEPTTTDPTPAADPADAADAAETTPDDAGATTGEKTTDAKAAAEPKRPSSASMGRTDKMPIKMLNDRILVRMGGAEGERRSNGGILIPATAQMGKRLTWAEVVAVGPNVRSVEEGDQVLFNPEDRYEVEVQGEDLIILRERDIHAVAAPRLAEGSTGLYL